MWVSKKARFEAARVRQVSVTSGDDEEYGHNNECRAIEVVGQDWSSEVVALLLEDWGARARSLALP